MKSIHDEWSNQDYLDFYNSFYGDRSPQDVVNWDWYAVCDDGGEGDEAAVYLLHTNGQIEEGCRRILPYKHDK